MSYDTCKRYPSARARTQYVRTRTMYTHVFCLCTARLCYRDRLITKSRGDDVCDRETGEKRTPRDRTRTRPSARACVHTRVYARGAVGRNNVVRRVMTHDHGHCGWRYVRLSVVLLFLYGLLLVFKGFSF